MFAMVKLASLSGDNLNQTDINNYSQRALESTKLYFSENNPKFEEIFFGLSKKEIQEEEYLHLLEIHYQYIFTTISSIEAAFMVDYTIRCTEKKKDHLSREMRRIQRNCQTKSKRPSFDEDILEAWANNTTGTNQIISDLRVALKLRHWLAHGRYWTPKFGRRHDFTSIATLSQTIYSSLPLEG